MIEWDRRSKWTEFKPNCVPQDPRSRSGTTLHWTGSKGSEFHANHDQCLTSVAGIEEYQLNSPDYEYCAIEYNAVVCRHGRGIIGRGLAKRSGANGTAESNMTHGSILLLMGQADPLTATMKHAVRQAARELSPLRPKDFVPHSKWVSTACPGPEVRAWIADGCPDPKVRAAMARLTEKIRNLRKRRREMRERA